MAKKEKVILVGNSELGKNFKVTELRKGFVKYLLPKRKVMLYNKKNLSWIEKQKVQQEQKKILVEEKAQELYKKVNNFILTFTLKKNEKGEPFGSVGFKELSQELEKAGIHLEKSHLTDFHSLSKLGENVLQVKLSSNLIANLKVVLN
jgi:ribosomal protein L9